MLLPLGFPFSSRLLRDRDRSNEPHAMMTHNIIPIDTLCSNINGYTIYSLCISLLCGNRIDMSSPIILQLLRRHRHRLRLAGSYVVSSENGAIFSRKAFHSFNTYNNNGIFPSISSLTCRLLSSAENNTEDNKSLQPQNIKLDNTAQVRRYNNQEIIQRLYEISKPERKLIIGSAATLAVTSSITLLLPYACGTVLDGAIEAACKSLEVLIIFSLRSNTHNTFRSSCCI